MHFQMCEDCRKVEAKDYWRACVQIRQKCDFKKTLFYLEQLLLKYGANTNTTGIKPVSTGIDFYYAKLQDARKLVDFVVSVLPCKYQYAQVYLFFSAVLKYSFDLSFDFDLCGSSKIFFIVLG